MSIRLLLVRHTTPSIGAGICYGRTDIPLAPSASSDIRRCLEQLPATERVFSSPSLRCRRLAEALSARDHVPVVEDLRLLELDFGRWEGLPWDEVPREDFAHWSQNLFDAAPPDGESLRSLWARVASFSSGALHGALGTVTIVSHHGPLRALHAQLTGRGTEAIWDAHIPFGGNLAVALDSVQSRINEGPP